MSGISQFFIEKMLSHSTENLHRGNPLCFTKFLEWKKFMDKRGGASRFSVQIVLSLSTGSFCRGILLCFKRILVSKNVTGKRWGGYHNFPSEIVISQYRKISQGTTSVFHKVSGIGNSYGQEGGHLGFFVHTVFYQTTETFRKGNLLCSRKFWVSKKFIPKSGISGFNIEKLLTPSTETFQENSSVFHKNSGVESIYGQQGGGGGHLGFSAKLFCLRVPKDFVEKHFCVPEKVYAIGKC